MYYINVDSDDCSEENLSDYIFNKEITNVNTIGINDL